VITLKAIGLGQVKWLRQVEKRPPSHSLNCNSERNQAQTSTIIQMHTYRNTIKLCIEPPNPLSWTCTPLSVNLLQLFQTLLHSGLS